MAVLKILEDGHPSLKKSCRKVRRMTDELRQLVDDMAETMFAYNGIGLSANQVGVDYRVIVVMDEDEENRYRVYINPKIVKWSNELEYSDEGCLSFPFMVGMVARDLKVEMAAQKIDMKKVRVKAEGLYARVFQHETDHLNGIVFIDRVEEGTLRRVEPPDESELESEDEQENDMEDMPEE